MGVEIDVPFRIGASGTITVTNDPMRSCQNHVTALVATSKGERIMHPEYGVVTSDLLFHSDTGGVARLIGQRVSEAAAVWEPGATVTDVSTVFSAQGLAALTVQAHPADAPTTPGSSYQSVATITAGGTVLEKTTG